MYKIYIEIYAYIYSRYISKSLISLQTLYILIGKVKVKLYDKVDDARQTYTRLFTYLGI